MVKKAKLVSGASEKKSSKKAVTPVARKDKKVLKETKVVKTKKQKSDSSDVSYSVLSPKGEVVGSMALPNEIFGAEYNIQLVSQALRIYDMNQREGSAATKTRGMVEGSTRKIYRQKGTGRARHGGIRAPIFVGGGISFGPQPRFIHKSLPKQLKKKALASTLSFKAENNMLKIVDGLLDLPIKTKVFALMLDEIHVSKRILFVYGKESASLGRAARNIKAVSVLPFDTFSVHDVMTHAYVVFSKDGLENFIDKEMKK